MNSENKKQKSKSLRNALIPATIALILMLLLSSCATTKSTAIDVPFPSPFADDGSLIIMYEADAKVVVMPLWYWKKIIRYGIDTGGITEE